MKESPAPGAMRIASEWLSTSAVHSFAARRDSIAPLAALRKLELLMLEGPLGPLAIDLEAVAEMKQLADLVLADSEVTKITSAASLGALRQLRRLNLGCTSLVTLQGLFDRELETLVVPATVGLEEVRAYRARHPTTEIVHGWRRLGAPAG